jgi:dihydrofolate reductase
VHLVGGPRTIEAYRELGALDKLELVALPVLFGAGMRLTDALSPEAGLKLEGERALPSGSVEIVYAIEPGGGDADAREASWAPASQRRD